MLSSFVAGDGKNYKPQIVNRIVSTEGKVIKTFEPVVNADVKLKPGVLTIVKDGMRGVVNEPGGTAGASKVQNVLMSGKTGTAQAGSDKVKLGDHAWFIAYAPSVTHLSPWQYLWNTGSTVHPRPRLSQRVSPRLSSRSKQS